jgi:hypothetical protein
VRKFCLLRLKRGYQDSKLVFQHSSTPEIPEKYQKKNAFSGFPDLQNPSPGHRACLGNQKNLSLNGGTPGSTYFRKPFPLFPFPPQQKNLRHGEKFGHKPPGYAYVLARLPRSSVLSSPNQGNFHREGYF